MALRNLQKLFNGYAAAVGLDRTRDLLLVNHTSYFSKESINPENDGHENKQIQRRTDHWLFEAGRSRMDRN
jgi:hypothetical protein